MQKVKHYLLDMQIILNKERLCEEWKKFIIVPIYKKSDKTDCNNC